MPANSSSQKESEASRRLAAAIEKAMSVDPADRFQTAEDFKKVLLGSKSKTQQINGQVYGGSPTGYSGDDAQKCSRRTRSLRA